MPNWCFQHVEVYAKTKEELTEFISFCKQTHESKWTKWTDFDTAVVSIGLTGTSHGRQHLEEVIIEQTTGVFWNFLPPTDLDTYFGITPKEQKFEPISISEPTKIMEKIMGDMLTANDWYNWNVRNWGTKWDIEPDGLDENEIQDGSSEYWINWNFETAWSPAEPMYLLMSERFPNLRFEYEISEEANFFLGYAIYEGGEELESNWIQDPKHGDFISFDMECSNCGTRDNTCSYCDECYSAPCECEEEETNLVLSADNSGAQASLASHGGWLLVRQPPLILRKQND